MTYTFCPVWSTAIPEYPPINRAAVPIPSLVPAVVPDEPPPARVETSHVATDILRTRLLPESVTKTASVVAATPKGCENRAALPMPLA